MPAAGTEAVRCEGLAATQTTLAIAMPETSDSTDIEQHEKPLQLPDLPDVPLLWILSYLPRQDLLAAGLTCARLGALTRANAALWTRSWPAREQGFDAVKGLSRVAPPVHRLRLSLGECVDACKLPLAVGRVECDGEQPVGEPETSQQRVGGGSPEGAAGGGLSWSATTEDEDLGLSLIRELGPRLTHLAVLNPSSFRNFEAPGESNPVGALLAGGSLPRLRALTLSPFSFRLPPTELFRDIPVAAIPALELLTLDGVSRASCRGDSWQELALELQDLVRRAPQSLHVTAVFIAKEEHHGHAFAGRARSYHMYASPPGGQLQLAMFYGHPVADEADCPLCAEAVAAVRASHESKWSLQVVVRKHVEYVVK